MRELTSTAAAGTSTDVPECWTAKEIAQQPAVLRATQALLDSRSAEIDAFLAPLLADKDLRIVLTGAGSSDFIGQCLAPVLRRALGRRVEAIATTDIVGTPDLALAEDVPTLLVSFGRSGNSPESIAAIAVAGRKLSRLHHLIVTCNASGALAQNDIANSLVISLPEESHDRGFAMTSSFSAMMYCALSTLTGTAAMQDRIGAIADATQGALAAAGPLAAELAQHGFARTIYLGSGPLFGLAREAALKLLELTDGQIATMAETPLGFRHGPKTFVDDSTLVVFFLSNDPLTRRYDLDMLHEMQRDDCAGRILVCDAQGADGADIAPTALQSAGDSDLLFPYVVLPQMLALAASFAHGITPDTPSRSGTVNRVVQGVIIHEGAQ